VEGAEAAGPNGLLNVRILKHHEGGVAAQFKVHTLEQTRRKPRHLPAGGHRSRKRDDRNIWMGDEFSSNVAATREDMEDVSREARLVQTCNLTYCTA
jgi:hypothetical protein